MEKRLEWLTNGLAKAREKLQAHLDSDETLPEDFREAIMSTIDAFSGEIFLIEAAKAQGGHISLETGKLIFPDTLNQS